MTNNLNAQIFKIKKCTAERFGEKFNEGYSEKGLFMRQSHPPQQVYLGE